MVDSFITCKKLQFNQENCTKIHCGKNIENCPNLGIQGKETRSSDSEKYLGDILTNKCDPHSTIIERIAKGYGILSNIRAILHDIPLGSKYIEFGILLRNACFINSTLFNSEADIKKLSNIDRQILVCSLGSNAKVSTEMLYLETASLPLEWIIRSRRLRYLQTLLKQDDTELTKCVYNNMKKVQHLVIGVRL